MRDIILTAIMAILLPWALFEPHIGVYTWYWIGLLNPHRLVYGFAYTIPFALLTAGATLLGLLIAKEKMPIPWNISLILMAILLVLATLSNFTAWDPEASWQYWDRIIKIFASTFVMTKLIFGKNRIITLLLIAALSIGFYGIKGGIFSIFTGGQHRVLGPPGDTALTGNTFIGLALIMILPILMALSKLYENIYIKYGLISAAGLCLISVVFTYSRGALIGLIVILIFGLLKSHKTPLILVAVLVALPISISHLPKQLTDRATSIQTYEEDASAMQRVRAWHVNYLIALDHPVLGAGFNFEARNASRWMSYMPTEYEKFGLTAHVAHSNYFQVLGTQGFIALFCYVGILTHSIIFLVRTENRARDSTELSWIAPLAKGLRLSVIGYAAAGAFINTAYFDLFYLFVGLSAVLWREVNHPTPSFSATTPEPISDMTR